jgi:hypothetical protein
MEVEVLNRQQYDGLIDKLITLARPYYLSYDPGATQQASPLGTISMYPIPDASTTYTLYLGEQKPLAEFTAITDVVTFQTAYYEALRYNLDERLWGPYHDDKTPVPQWILGLAKTAKGRIKRMNLTNNMPVMKVEAPGKKGSYNINVGPYGGV